MSIDWNTFGIDGAVDWRAIEAEFPYAGEMAACIQDEIYHAEGDVLTHTRMVMDHLFADPEFQKSFVERFMFQPIVGSPDELMAFVRKEEPKWRKIIADAKIKVE